MLPNDDTAANSELVRLNLSNFVRKVKNSGFDSSSRNITSDDTKFSATVSAIDTHLSMRSRFSCEYAY